MSFGASPLPLCNSLLMQQKIQPLAALQNNHGRILCLITTSFSYIHVSFGDIIRHNLCGIA